MAFFAQNWLSVHILQIILLIDKHYFYLHNIIHKESDTFKDAGVKVQASFLHTMSVMYLTTICKILSLAENSASLHSKSMC